MMTSSMKTRTRKKSKDDSELMAMVSPTLVTSIEKSDESKPTSKKTKKRLKRANTTAFSRGKWMPKF